MKWLSPYMFANVGFLAVVGVLAVTMAGCSSKIEDNSSVPLQNASSINAPSKDALSADSKQSCENVYTYELGKELNIVIQDSTQKWTIHKIDQKNDRLKLFFTLENVDSVDSLIDLDINYAVASYVRGQITVAFWVGVMFSLGYILIGLPYGVALAILAGFMNLIPYFGTPLAMIPVIVISIMTSGSMLIKVLIVFAIEQTIESRILSPWVMGNKMEMHPITTILLLIGASAVWGLWGVVFGIPIYAILKIIVSRVYNYYRRESKLFEENAVSSTTGDADHDESE